MGQLGSAMTNPNTYGSQPSGMNGTDWAARFMGSAAKGAGQGLQAQGQPMRPQGGPPQMATPMPQQPQVNLPQGGPPQSTVGLPNGQPSSRMKNPFFGQ